MGYKSRYTGAQVEELLGSINDKQEKLISGVNIKTINGESIIGSGDIVISGDGNGYSAKIDLETPQYNAVLSGSYGHYIVFTFDTINKTGASIGEGVTCVYTITRGTNTQIVTEKYRYNTRVRFSLDKYIQEGANDIVINITGDISGLSTSIGVTYHMVSLDLSAIYDISNVCNLSSSTSTIVEVPFTVTGYGTKIVEWYIDGHKLDFVKNDDEVVDVEATRTKYLTISNLSQGKHSLQIRAYTTVNGEIFYSDTLYYDLLVYTGVNNDTILGVSTVIPRKYGIIEDGSTLKFYGVTQYIPYSFNFASYSPTMTASTDVTISINSQKVSSVISRNGVESTFMHTPKNSGTQNLVLSANGLSYSIPMQVEPTSMDIAEINTALILNFDAEGMSNTSDNKDAWSYGGYTGTFSGFNWNNTSGWVNGRLEISAGATFSIDYAPLADNPTRTGKTIEVEWMTKNVTNDNAVICDLRGDNGVGILITATKVSMCSADGVVVETEYKSDENVRIGFVINPSRGTTNQRLSFIYANGVISRGEKWSVNDNYTSNKYISFNASNEVEISLKSIRIYDTALTPDQMLNNFQLYRDTIEEMLEAYDRNDVYIDGTTTFSPDKMSSRLPVMIITGDIPVLENTSDKNTQIVVDIDYINMQDTSRNFRMEGAAMRPQGTSSMGYPKKNFRIYTQKVDGTVLYDSNGDVVEDNLYSFKEGAQPVNCWCLKADYAESSGTHNTGIARLWNTALVNAQIDGEYKLRTKAQTVAIESGYPYDVRTTIDGFPILLFYRPSSDDNVIFIGKYNFNNDKSTESVFGFKGIPNFDNSKMQCWEVLNNGNPLALFTTIDDFDKNWAEAFESRYPDTKTPYTGDLKAFCEWMSSVSAENFASQKWEHLDVYKMAAYWCYLMRHAGADQFVKNAMFTSEDGVKWYYILYDNDTINGLINTGRLRIEPTDDRQTVDESGAYVFAGHDSRLWNLLEADDEFKDIVSAVDNALYSAGISYANTIKMFDEEQAGKWVERVYNQDAQYKYIGPYVEKGVDNLFMLQGKRDLHRKWWLAKRFSIYDAKYVSGTYKSQAVELKCINGTSAGQKITIVSGYSIDYGFGINNVPREFGIALNEGDSYTFITKEVVNLGDPIRIYGAPHIAELDLSAMAEKLAVITITNVFDEALGTKLTKLVIGNKDISNSEVSEISGLKQATALEYIDVQGMTKILSLDLSNHIHIKTIKAKGSGVSSVTFAKGAPVESVELPSAIRVLSLEQLPYLNSQNVSFESMANISDMVIKSCPNISNDFAFVWHWISSKITDDANCKLAVDNIDWVDVSGEQMAKIALIGDVSLKGKILLTDLTEEQGTIIEASFGKNVFIEGSELFIDAPITLTFVGATSILEGETETYYVKHYPEVSGTKTYSLITPRQGCSIDPNTGVLTTVENGLNTSDIIIRATFTQSNGDPEVYADFPVSVVKRTYPNDVTINGEENPITSSSYWWSTNTDGVNGDMVAEWYLSGDITDYFEIEDYSLIECLLRMTFPPLGKVSGLLTLVLKKAYNNEVILTATKLVAAEYDGVIITSRSNAPIQASLYNAGLVANETHTFKHEVEAITNKQLQPGESAATSIFNAQRDNIRSFSEFQYFRGITSIFAYTFAGCINLANITIPNSITSIGDYAFAECSSLDSISLPDGCKSIGLRSFMHCSNMNAIYIPVTTTAIANKSFELCGRLNIYVDANNATYSSMDGVLFSKNGASLIEYAKDVIEPNYSVPYGVQNIGDYAFYNCSHMESITIPSTLTSITGHLAFGGCSRISTIISNAVNAPSANISSFGDDYNSYTGSDSQPGRANKLYIPLNATGYESGVWLDPLQNADKCGFNIHGKLTIVSNRNEATFNVSYITTSGTSKTLTLSVGTSYINDIKYGSTMIITPIALSLYNWDWASKEVVYDGHTTIINNAYIYPANATILGASNPCYDPIYTWSTTTDNIDGSYSVVWSLSDSLAQYMSIETQDGEKCVMNVTYAPEEVVYGTLSLKIIKDFDGSILLTATKDIALQVVIRPTSAIINGDSTIFYKGYVHTYHLEIIPSNTNVTYITSWNLSSTDNIKMVSSTNDTCTIRIESEGSSDTAITLTATVMSTDGVSSVTCSKVITLARVVRPTALSFTSGNSEVRFIGNYTYVVEPTTTPENVSLSYVMPVLSGDAVTHGNVALVSANNGVIVILVSNESTADLTFTITQSATVSGNGSTISVSKNVTLKSIIRPTSISIDGKQNIQGGNDYTYTAILTPASTNIDMTYSWSISGSQYISITDKTGATCTLTASVVEEDSSFTLTCTAISADNKTVVQNTFSGKVIPKPSIITATYNVTSTTSTTQLLSSSYSLNNVTLMEIDGVEVTPSTAYTFSTTGSHNVRFSLSALNNAFRNVNGLVSIDFSEFRGKSITNLVSCFESCSALSLIDWGECSFPNVTNLGTCFFSCSSLKTIDLTPFNGAPITNMQYTFGFCTSLESLDMSPINGNSVTNIANCFRGCTSLSIIEWGDTVFPKVTSLTFCFYDCSTLTSIDLTPFYGAKITSLESCFNRCKMLDTLDLSPLVDAKITSLQYCFQFCNALSTIIMPWSVAPSAGSYTFGTSANDYTGRNTYSTGRNRLYVPSGATGYDSGYWLDPLCNSEKCGFTLSVTL